MRWCPLTVAVLMLQLQYYSSRPTNKSKPFNGSQIVNKVWDNEQCMIYEAPAKVLINNNSELKVPVSNKVIKNLGLTSYIHCNSFIILIFLCVFVVNVCYKKSRTEISSLTASHAPPVPCSLTIPFNSQLFLKKSSWQQSKHNYLLFLI